MEDYKVYCHTNVCTGQRYVGITGKKRVEERWSNGKGYKGNPYFTHAINYYGWDSFSHEVLVDGLTLEEAASIEMQLIDEWNLMDKRFGYNLTMGGEGAYGRVGSEKQKEAARKTRTGTHLSDHSKKLISECHKNWNNTWNKGLTGEANPRYGIPRSEEVKRKISQANKGVTRVVRPVQKISTGEVFPSIRAAHRATGTSGNTIRRHLRKETLFEPDWRYYE